MALAQLITRLLASLEGRHWLGLGFSLAMHVVVVLLYQVPTITPQPLTFEVALAPPEEARLPTPKAKRSVAGNKAKKPKVVAKRPEKREPQVLDTAWKRETAARRDAPSVVLPDERTLGIQSEQGQGHPATRLAQTPPAASRAAAKPAAESSGDAGLSEPATLAQGQAQTGQPGKDAGIALTPAQTLALVAGVVAGERQGESVGQATLAAAPGQGSGALSVSERAGAGNANLAGAGAASREANTSQAATGGEANGIRLSASTALGGLAALTPSGNLIAAPASGDSGRASAEQGSGSGLAHSAGAQASASQAPGAMGGGRAGTGGADGAAPGAIKGGTERPGGTRLAGSSAPGKAVMARTGTATGPQAQAPSANALAALAPSEPGGSPQRALALQPVLAQVAPKGMPAGGGGSRSAAGAASAGASGEPETSVGGTRSGGGESGPGRRLSLQNAKVTAVKLIRPDSQAQALDVLAPSSFCPLPGHQPDNRAPKPGKQQPDDKPTYAADNPNLYFPPLAMLQGREGRVTVRVEVRPDGHPGQMLLKQSSGSAILDDDARNQLTRWKFLPVRRNGQAVTTWIDVPVIYRLPNKTP